jgi:hypothetical protein
MIFKLVDEILSGTKTQTRRVVKPGEDMICSDDYGAGYGDGPIIQVVALHAKPDKYGLRVYSKWIVGRTYAVVPKRGKPAVWWKHADGGEVELLHEHPQFSAFREMLNTSRATWRLVLEDLRRVGWHELRIRITAIRQERLQDISEADAQAEGVASVEEYKALWARINGKTKGARWEDNPAVWVLTFELVQP